MATLQTMKSLLPTSIVAVLLITQMSLAQQSPSPTQPAQAQTLPCSAVPPPATPRANNSRPTIIDRWKKKLNDESAKLQVQTGVPMPTTGDLASLANTNSTTCPPKTAAPVPPAGTVPPAPLKLPPDILVTLRCNPMTPSPQGGNRQTGLTLPDPKDFALPKATDFLADSVVPDLSAKTPCYLIKVDPKTGKSFVQQ